MHTSLEWWNKTKASKNALNSWLIRQYRGEVTAASRIIRLGEKFSDTIPSGYQSVLDTIAKEEARHAGWIKDLISGHSLDLRRSMNIAAAELNKAEERYWKDALSGIDTFEKGSAIAAHAEAMRLERIRTIAEDEDCDRDINEVFNLILLDEEFHERSFRAMTTDSAMSETLSNHQAGMQALGLEI